jgi:hypothetical protein
MDQRFGSPPLAVSHSRAVRSTCCYRTAVTMKAQCCIAPVTLRLPAWFFVLRDHEEARLASLTSGAAKGGYSWPDEVVPLPSPIRSSRSAKSNNSRWISAILVCRASCLIFSAIA